MELVLENSNLLANFEVYQVLKEVKARNSVGKSLQNLNTVTYEVLKYLERTPCSVQTPEVIADFVSALDKYDLTRAEKLQMLNSRPVQPVEVHLVVEECEERLSEEMIDELINLVDLKLPAPACLERVVSDQQPQHTDADVSIEYADAPVEAEPYVEAATYVPPPEEELIMSVESGEDDYDDGGGDDE